MRSAHGVVCVIGVRAAGGVRVSQIVLQKSKVAGPRIFRENTKREAIADSYSRQSRYRSRL